jgi:hypothetical protein
MTLWMKPWVPTQSVGIVTSWLLQTCLFRRLTCNSVGNKIVYYKDTVECRHQQFWPEGRGERMVMLQSWSHIRVFKAAGSLCMWENARKFLHPASWK